MTERESAGDAAICLLSYTGREESPDRTGHFTAEIADRGNLMVNVTENYRMPLHARVKMRGKSSRRLLATAVGYVPEVCKTKYTGSQGLPVRCQGVCCEDKWQI